VIFGKLRNELGDETLARVVDQCLDAPTSFRDCAAQQSGVDLGGFFAQWLQPYPQLNYRFAEVQTNRATGDGYRQELTIERVSNRDVAEPVDVQLRSIGGQTLNVHWDGRGQRGTLVTTTSDRVCQAAIDPDRRLIETTRADNARPPEAQLVLDTAEVEISSTEFGFAALAVARERYDYRKDLAVAGVYTNRGVGADVGPRLHFGPPIDANSYRHNIYGFYSVEALDAGFHDKRHPDDRSAGHINGIGARYDYNDVYAWDNPTNNNDLRLFADWYDRSLGSDFNYVDWGASLVVTRPLFTPRTVLAAELTNSFSEPLGNSVVPLQGRYSLGGSRSIRGIGAEEEIGRNLFLLRTEIRRSIYPEIDHNFLDALVARRFQVHAFVDTGQVSNSAGAVYDPRGYAVGVGVGVGLVYEFLGFFPSLAYIELATRVDRSDDLGDVQFLFGTRQPF
ncbi:MAG TPA: BamA/TamA family outer membrane protein, partial [Candidatus Acidoferrales bacterium]|nr:BamA/TamA family outer membrane protein [Candidatus Acidoferrales bacterium]